MFLEYAGLSLRSDRELGLLAVRTTPYGMEVVTGELKRDKALFAELLAREGWFILGFADPSLQVDCELALTAVRQDGWALLGLNGALFDGDKEPVTAAAASNPWAIL